MAELDKVYKILKGIPIDMLSRTLVDWIIQGAKERGLSDSEIISAFEYLENTMKEIQPLLQKEHKTMEEAEKAQQAFCKALDDFAELLQHPHGTRH